MTTPPWYILSDCHVGAAPAATTDALLVLLRRLRGAPGSLILNGDILDFWFEWRRSIPSFALPVLGALGELRAAGMPITWIAGNHDCWGGDVLRGPAGHHLPDDADPGTRGCVGRADRAWRRLAWKG